MNDVDDVVHGEDLQRQACNILIDKNEVDAFGENAVQQQAAVDNPAGDNPYEEQHRQQATSHRSGLSSEQVCPTTTFS